ncbi:MAG: hypothetical protein KGJ78_01765 [Alphaproteobacteria bacterium]|nr:hypothetical protein [Alphaproteobacteria bacterium]
MKRAIVVLLAAFAAQAIAAPVTDFKQIQKALNGIPTAAGVSLGKRLANCKIVVHKDATWMETRNVAWPDYGAKPGDTVLHVVMDLPQAPNQPGPSGSVPQQKNVVAVWVISGGKATPLSSWAQALQNRPVPLGYDASNNC